MSTSPNDSDPYRESPWEYRLQYDESLNLSSSEQAEAYKRMSRYGRWFEKMWWQPVDAERAAGRIKREGFKCEDIRAART